MRKATEARDLVLGSLTHKEAGLLLQLATLGIEAMRIHDHNDSELQRNAVGLCCTAAHVTRSYSLETHEGLAWKINTLAEALKRDGALPEGLSLSPLLSSAS